MAPNPPPIGDFVHAVEFGPITSLQWQNLGVVTLYGSKIVGSSGPYSQDFVVAFMQPYLMRPRQSSSLDARICEVLDRALAASQDCPSFRRRINLEADPAYA